MTFFLRCDRSDFVGYLSARASIDSHFVSNTIDWDDLRPEELVLAWKESPESHFSLPNAIVVKDGTLTDFNAWIGTYFRNIQPFSAQCRVLTREIANIAVNGGPTQWSRSNRSVDTALVIAESAAYSGRAFELTKLPFSAFERSLSYVMARAVRHYDITTLDQSGSLRTLESAWLQARELVREPQLSLSSDSVRFVWEVVLQSTNEGVRSRRRGDARLVDAVRRYKDKGQISKQDFFQCLQKNKRNEDIWKALDGSRENRVIALEEAGAILSRGTKSTLRQRAFVLGYIASRIQPGTFDHISLLFPFAEQLQESLLWFGVFAGLTNDTMVDDFAGGLGWLLRRELGRLSHWLERPSCDVSIDEFILCYTAGVKRPTFRNTSNGVLKIEVFPLVNTNVRWSQGQQEANVANRPDLKQGKLFEDLELRKGDVKRIAERMDEHSREFTRIQQDFISLLKRWQSG
ncbi:hypothetical protein [Roseiconus lacunae]|uniref:hypothetical protein n=1 Tax=Roseiconus lacunae TaxID=2605694 RepID=UPI0011F3A89B|nr:hypothetical protein [Roseiconus lacunae]